MATNLVHNAIVHNLAEHGTIWVTTSVQDESAVLTVENTGQRITQQIVATLAEPFQRGSRRTRTDHAGVGLGLAIVKSITHAHSGTLTLTPRDEGGLHITVHLPTAPAEARPQRWIPDRAQQLQNGGIRANSNAANKRP
jgi:two-component system sensor histidine kinase VanS